MIKGIIFDLDGTILSTLYDIQGSVNIVLKNHGYPVQDYEYVRLAIGRGSRNLIKDCLPEGISEQEIDKLTDEYIETYGHHYDVETKNYDGIQELLNELEARGIVLAVNSNKPNEFTNNLIKHHYPGNNFIAIIGARPNIPYKPDPYSANEIVKMMGFDKSEVLYVGDSDSDVNTAKNAGLKCVGCLWGFRDLKTLQDAGADYIISKPEEVLELLWHFLQVRTTVQELLESKE